jgi:hypothetical protein
MVYVCPIDKEKFEDRLEYLKHLMKHEEYKFVEERWLLGLYFKH